MTAIFTMIWNFLTSKLAGPIGLAASLALAVMLFVAHIQNGVLTKDAARAQASLVVATRNLDTANASLANESAALDAQNKAVAALQTESAQRSSAAAKAVQAAQVASAALFKREAEIAAVKPTTDLCASADAILAQGVTP